MTITTQGGAVPQLVLAGQQAAPEGPIDVAGMYVMHHAFRRDLTRLAAATGATPATDRTTWVRLSRRWEQFASYLHKHHHGEDSGLWPMLLERSTDDTAREVLTSMAAEHERIDPLLKACQEGFARLGQAADEDARRALAEDVAELGEHLRAHLAHEERDAMTLVQAHLTQHDWEYLDKEHFAAEYSPRETFAAIGWVMHELPEHVARQVIPGGKALFGLAKLIARRFARAERRAFRYVSAS